MVKQNDALFYTCSLIECIGRETKQPRGDIVRLLGRDLDRIYSHADVFHCEMLLKVAYDFIDRLAIPSGLYDVVAMCRYKVPDCWEIGSVFERLIEDCYKEEDALKGVREVFGSWLAEKILHFNSDLYYQPREYLAACYKEGQIIAA